MGWGNVGRASCRPRRDVAPSIRGMSVFHYHLFSHEDKGMMAKILFE